MATDAVMAPSGASGHYLLTVLGTNPSEARYALDGRLQTSRLAPLALLALLPDSQRPDCVVALCTEQARETSLPILQSSLPDSCSLIPVDVPSGHSQDDINTFLTRATAAIPDATADSSGSGILQLTIDVTHGFRHFSFLTYLAGLYLVGLRQVELIGAWYGLLQRDQDSPFLDLRPLLELPRWIQALQVLRDTGSALPLARALTDGVEKPLARDVGKELRQISDAYLSALPLELGLRVQQFRQGRLGNPQSLIRLLRDDHRLPLAKELLQKLDQLLLPFSFSDQQQEIKVKTQVALDEAELHRQGRFIDDLLLHNDDAVALGLLDEWTVSWAIWTLGQTADWLDYKSRRRQAAGLVGALAAACQNASLTALLSPEQKALGDFWHLLTNLRNGFHHHGMRREELVGNRKTSKELERVKAYWRQTLRACPRLSLTIGAGDGGPLLISPIGQRPGVLYSALLACRERVSAEPAACLVICSHQSGAVIEAAAARAHYSGLLIRLVLNDPYGGHSEFGRLEQEAQETCLKASAVLVNVTGGTTLMGLAAQKLEDLARSFARPVQRFGLIDRRPAAQQEADPYQRGEAFWL